MMLFIDVKNGFLHFLFWSRFVRFNVFLFFQSFFLFLKNADNVSERQAD